MHYQNYSIDYVHSEQLCWYGYVRGTREYRLSNEMKNGISERKWRRRKLVS